MSSRVLLAVAILSVGLVRANELAAGWAHSVVVKDGEVWSWGDNRYGQLGQPDSERSIYPRPVPGIKNITAVAASWHTLALTKEGAVYAWGRNDLGQLGNGAYGIGKQSEVPVRVVGLSDVVAIAAGWEHSMALTRSGEVYFWGSRSHGVAGDGSRVTGTPVVVPQKIEALRGVKAIAAGGQHSLALLQDGSVLAWGSNWNGQLGNGKIGKSGHSAVPQPVSDPEWRAALSGIVAIAAGALHSVAVAADGTGYAWGYNGTGQIGDGERGGFWGNAGRTDINRPIITRVNRDKKVPFKSGKLCAAGFEATYILGTDRKIYATGWSVYGEQASGAFGGGNRDHLEAAVTGR